MDSHYDGGEGYEQPDEGLSGKHKKQVDVCVTACCVIAVVCIVISIFSKSKEQELCSEGTGCKTYHGPGYLDAKQRAAQRASDNESSCAGNAGSEAEEYCT